MHDLSYIALPGAAVVDLRRAETSGPRRHMDSYKLSTGTPTYLLWSLLSGCWESSTRSTPPALFGTKHGGRIAGYFHFFCLVGRPRATSVKELEDRQEG